MKGSFEQIFQKMMPLVILATISCGKLKDNAENRRNSSDSQGRSQDTENGAFMQATGSVKDGDATAQRLHTLNSQLKLPAFLAAQIDKQTGTKLKSKLVLQDANDAIIFEQVQDVKAVDAFQSWSFKLEGQEGRYKIVIQLQDPDKVLETEVRPWEAWVELDTTQPQLSVDASIGVITDDGKRPLSLNVTVNNESGSKCNSSQVEQPSLKDPLPLTLRADSAAQEGRVQKYTIDSGTLFELNTNNALVRVICQDRAGNAAEVLQPLVVKGSRALNLRVKPVGSVGRPLGSAADAPVLTFVRPGALKLSMELIDPLTGLRLTDKVLEAEKGTLRLFVSDTMPTDVNQLLGNRAVLSTGSYAAETSLPLPSSYLGARTLYVSLVKLDQATNKDVLVSSIAVPLFVDDSSPQLTFMTEPQYRLPVKAAPMSLTARLDLEGAPLASPLTAEYSIDNKVWTNIAIQDLPSPGDAAIRRITFAYPLDAEADLRLRLKAIDLAGQSHVSSISPHIVGRAGLALSVPAAERSNCKINNTPAFKLQVNLGSSYLCKKSDVNGVLTGLDHVNLVLQNRGQVVPQFFKSTEIPEGMGYRVLLDGQIVENGRISPPTAFQLDATNLQLLQFPIKNTWLEGQKLELLFDIESTDANSTLNGCYLASDLYPRVTLQDKANNLTLKNVIYPCDRDGTVLR